MKYSHFFLFAFLSFCLTLISCNTKKESDPVKEESTVSPTGTTPQDAAATTNTTATPGNTEPHFKCTTPGCTGSGSAQGKCPVCGSDLVHNQAFHTQQQGIAGSSPDNAVQINPATGGASATPTPPPAQNAKGVYHYTCPNGHEGGAGAAGNCAKCGTALVHNQAYHQE